MSAPHRDDSPFGATINPDGQRNGIHFEGTDGWIWVNRDEINASDRELLSKPAAGRSPSGCISATITWAISSTA